MKNKALFSTFLLFIAILSTLLAWSVTNIFVVEISLWHFIVIEAVISISHGFYNKIKEQYKPIK